MRYTFGGSEASYVVTRGVADADGKVPVVFAPGQEVRFWTAQTGGTQFTDLVDSTGIETSSVTTDDDGAWPQVSGPDGVTYMWAQAGDGPRRLTVATNLGDQLEATRELADQAKNATDGLAAVASSGSYADLADTPAVWTRDQADARYVRVATDGRPDRLRGWFDAIDTRDRHGVDVLVVGDSWGEGQGASAIANRWVDLLRDQLRAQLNPPAVAGGVGYIPSWYKLPNLASPWRYTGTTAEQEVFGFGRRNIRLSPNATMSLTFTGTGFDVYYANGATGGVFSWQIDGGVSPGSSNNDTTDQSRFDTGYIGANLGGQTFRVRGLLPGSHTVKLSMTDTAAQYGYIEGATVYDGDADGAGVRVWDASHWGYDSADMDGGNGSQWAAIATVPADLVVVPLGINDWRHKLVTPAQYADNLTALVGNVRRHVTHNASVMLWTMPETKPVTGQVAPWSEFKDQVAVVAERTGAYVFDASAVIPDITSGSTTLWDADQIHPNNAGHAALADALAPILLP